MAQLPSSAAAQQFSHGGVSLLLPSVHVTPAVVTNSKLYFSGGALPLFTDLELNKLRLKVDYKEKCLFEGFFFPNV